MRRLLLLLTIAACLTAADDRIKVDNEYVRVIDAVQAPHVKGVLHRHEANRVMVYLDAVDLVVTHEDGRVEKQHWNAGQVAWAPAGGMHTSENVGALPGRVIEVEIKRPAPARPPARNRALDPIALDPRHNVLLFNNPQVRVFRSWREPGGTEMMHEHPAPGRLAVMLTDLDAGPQHASRGEALWSGAVTHATTNTGHQPFEMIVIEIK